MMRVPLQHQPHIIQTLILAPAVSDKPRDREATKSNHSVTLIQKARRGQDDSPAPGDVLYSVTYGVRPWGLQTAQAMAALPG